MLNQGDEGTKKALQIYVFIMGILTFLIFLAVFLPARVKF
jgi:hypothetical protein